MVLADHARDARLGLGAPRAGGDGRGVGLLDRDPAGGGGAGRAGPRRRVQRAGRRGAGRLQRPHEGPRVRRRRVRGAPRRRVLLELRRPAAVPAHARRGRAGPDHARDGRRASVRGRARHGRRRVVARRARTARRRARSRGRPERARRDPDRRLGGASGDRVGPRLLRRSAHLARRHDALLPRVGSPLDAVGRHRAVRGGPLRRRDARGGSSRGRSRRRGVDLAADVEPRRRAVLGERSQRSVEPRTRARRRTSDGASGAGGVRLAAVDLRGVVVRVPGRRPDRVPFHGRRGRSHRDPRSGDRRAHRDGPAPDRDPASEPRRRGDVGGVRRRVALDGAADRAARPDDAGRRRPAREQPGRRRSRVPVHARADRVPDCGRADRVRALLSPLERRLPRPRGGAPAPDRDEPRGTDVAGRPVAGPRDPVLDQPRLRRGRRELRGQHRVRPGVPAAPQRHLGGRRYHRLHQRRALPRGRGTGGRGEARDPGRVAPAGTRRSAR